MDSILLHFYIHFRVVFVVFVGLYLKFGVKILIFTVTAVMLERGLFLPPPSPFSHQEVIDAI